jgi:Ribbon-helix-helix domain
MAQRTNLNLRVSKRTTKRSITIKNHKTSISLENQFWDCLREIAGERGVSLVASGGSSSSFVACASLPPLFSFAAPIGASIRREETADRP